MPPKRKTIPKALKEQVWDKYVGKERGIAKCLVCNDREISKSSFHAGHIKSVKNGGDTTIDNLLPICSHCNLSMGKQNLYEYKAEFHQPLMDLD